MLQTLTYRSENYPSATLFENYTSTPSNDMIKCSQFQWQVRTTSDIGKEDIEAEAEARGTETADEGVVEATTVVKMAIRFAKDALKRSRSGYLVPFNVRREFLALGIQL